MRRFALVAILVLTLALAGCNHTTSNLHLTEADNGKTVQMKVGQDLRVALASNPSTGYGWEIVEVDAQVLVQQGEPTFRDGNAEGMVGASGTETFQFKAQRTGTTTLELVYQQSFNPGQDTRTFQVTVHVSA